MRLIDADLLTEKITKLLKYDSDADDRMVNIDDIAVSVLMEIEEQPTAYDVDKVIYNLDKISDYYECNEQGREHVQMVNFEPAVDIVRLGGLE